MRFFFVYIPPTYFTAVLRSGWLHLMCLAVGVVYVQIDT